VIQSGNGKKKHIPIRTCIVCGRKSSKWELRRLALDRDGFVVIDAKQAMQGRGAYCCEDCLGSLKWDKKLQRAFRGKAKGLRLEPSLTSSF